MATSYYTASELDQWLEDSGMGDTRGRVYHSMAQGKIEYYRCSMKNQVMLDNYYLPGDLKAYLAAFIDYNSHDRYHESLDNLTPADVYFGRGQASMEYRARVKQKALRYKTHRKLAARYLIKMDQVFF